MLQMGYKIPEKMRVIGYGNTNSIDYCIPEMTYIKENTKEIARRTVSTIVEMIEGETKQAPQNIKIPVSIQIGQTA